MGVIMKEEIIAVLECVIVLVLDFATVTVFLYLMSWMPGYEYLGFALFILFPFAVLHIID